MLFDTGHHAVTGIGMKFFGIIATGRHRHCQQDSSQSDGHRPAHGSAHPEKVIGEEQRARQSHQTLPAYTPCTGTIKADGQKPVNLWF
ncbi:hypothetical protein GCM10009093_06840 [Brevundimonas terrae]|uniref:Uncharacterized protein n=1 Tax=Brevundimonas terrae TaxID=363631 RepID=A0ABP3HXA6_9CAUL